MGYPFPPTRVGKSRRPFRLKRSIRQAHDEVVPLHVPLHWSNATWWLIPLSKWVTTLVINGISGVSPLITGVITHLRFWRIRWMLSSFPHLQVIWKSTTQKLYKIPSPCLTTPQALQKSTSHHQMDGWNPINNGRNHLSIGAGFRNHPPYGS